MRFEKCVIDDTCIMTDHDPLARYHVTKKFNYFSFTNALYISFFLLEKRSRGPEPDYLV